MALDFALTRLYRKAHHDCVLMMDVFRLYNHYAIGYTISDYLQAVHYVTRQELELTMKDGGETLVRSNRWSPVSLGVDYLLNVVLQYVLDELASYPFWAAKMAVATSNESFGKSALLSFWSHLTNSFQSSNVSTLIEGFTPYCIASSLLNFNYIMQSTERFLVTVMIPRGSSSAQLRRNSRSMLSHDSVSEVTSLTESHIHSPVSTPSNSVSVSKKNVEPSYIQKLFSDITFCTLSHPFLLCATHMICDPVYNGRSWLLSMINMVSKNGFTSLYAGLRSRLTFAIIPVAPLVYMGVADSIGFRRILGQGSFDSSGGVLSIARELSAGGISALTLANYGLLTAVQAVPGFLSFLSLRLFSSLIFGRSLFRDQQFHNRRRFVENFLTSQMRNNTESSKLRRRERR